MFQLPEQGSASIYGLYSQDAPLFTPRKLTGPGHHLLLKAGTESESETKIASCVKSGKTTWILPTPSWGDNFSSWDEIFVDDHQRHHEVKIFHHEMNFFSIVNIIPLDKKLHKKLWCHKQWDPSYRGILQKHTSTQEVKTSLAGNSFFKEIPRLSTQSDDITSRDFQHIGKSLRCTVLSTETSHTAMMSRQEIPFPWKSHRIYTRTLHHWQEILFSRKFHRLSTQSDDVTSRDFQLNLAV